MEMPEYRLLYTKLFDIAADGLQALIMCKDPKSRAALERLVQSAHECMVLLVNVAPTQKSLRRSDQEYQDG